MNELFSLNKKEIKYWQLETTKRFIKKSVPMKKNALLHELTRMVQSTYNGDSDTRRISSKLSSSVPEHWGIGMSDSRWMKADTFFSYMENVFYPCAIANVQFPIIFFVDGDVSNLF